MFILDCQEYLKHWYAFCMYDDFEFIKNKFKLEWNSDIYMLSVNGEDQEDVLVTVCAKLDKP